MKVVTEGGNVQVFRCPGGCGTMVPWRFTSCSHARHAGEPLGYLRVDPDALAPVLVPIDQVPGVDHVRSTR
jgi:hypothetical protein